MKSMFRPVATVKHKAASMKSDAASPAAMPALQAHDMLIGRQTSA